MVTKTVAAWSTGVWIKKLLILLLGGTGGVRGVQEIREERAGSVISTMVGSFHYLLLLIIQSNQTILLDFHLIRAPARCGGADLHNSSTSASSGHFSA